MVNRNSLFIVLIGCFFLWDRIGLAYLPLIPSRAGDPLLSHLKAVFIGPLPAGIDNELEIGLVKPAVKPSPVGLGNGLVHQRYLGGIGRGRLAKGFYVFEIFV